MAEFHIGGWLHEIEEQRAEFLMSLAMSPADLGIVLAADFEIPKEIDPRPWSPIRYQGGEGSCQGHAESAVGELCQYTDSGVFRQFSPDFAYYKTQERDGLLGSDQGSTIAGGIWVGKNIGHLPEELMPYSDTYNPRSIPAGALTAAAPYLVGATGFASSYADMVKWIGKGYGGGEFGILWNVQPDGAGDVKNYSEPNRGGGHANAFLGYGGGMDSDGLPAYLWAKNSWGKSWGLGGWWKCWRKAFEGMLRGRYTVIGMMSDMAKPTPRPSPWAAW